VQVAGVLSAASTLTFAFADTDGSGRPTSCIVTISKHMTGSLIVIPTSATDTTQADSSHTISKPFDMVAWHFPFRVVGGQAPVDYYP
jgi:hypothetical protein